MFDGDSVMKRLLRSLTIAGALASVPVPVAAQAFTLPQGVGTVTFGWQYVDNTGHRLSDGSLTLPGGLPTGGTSVDMSFLVETEFGFTDRLAASLGLAYVFAKWTDPNPPPNFIPYLPVDSCHCWHSSFQDFSLAVRYRLFDDPWAITPLVRAVLPSHDYNHRGEAVVGRDLREFQVGFGAARRLAGFLPRAFVQAGYTYAFVERVLGIPNDRSNGYFELGYAVSRRLYVRADARWQRTHGGLQFGSPSGDPFFPPGDVNTPERLEQHDRLLRDNYWRIGGGLSYSIGVFDVFADFTKYVAGTDTHDGQAYTVGLTYYFGGPFRQ
jgi:hypothetical protein